MPLSDPLSNQDKSWLASQIRESEQRTVDAIQRAGNRLRTSLCRLRTRSAVNELLEIEARYADRIDGLRPPH
jgi:hypothetical protein